MLLLLFYYGNVGLVFTDDVLLLLMFQMLYIP
jgi:hypothetical protein